MHLHVEKTSKDDYDEVYEKLNECFEGMNAVSCIRAMAAQIGSILAVGVASGRMQYDNTEEILKLIPISIKDSFEFIMRPENRKDTH